MEDHCLASFLHKVLEHEKFEVIFFPSDTSSQCTSSSAMVLLYGLLDLDISS